MKKNKRELSKIDNIEYMLLDGINVMHDLLNPDIRNKMDYEELKGIVAINNSLNASIKTYYLASLFYLTGLGNYAMITQQHAGVVE